MRPIKTSPENFRPSNPRDLPGPAQDRLTRPSQDRLRPVGLGAGQSKQPLGIIDLSDDPAPPSPRYQALETKVRNELSFD